MCNGIISGNPSVDWIGCQGEYVSGVTLEERHVPHSVEAGFVVHCRLLTYIEKRGLAGSLEQYTQSQILVADFCSQAVHPQWISAVRQRHHVQLVHHTVSIDILIFDVTGHYLSESLLGTVFDVIFVLKQSDCLISADGIVREIIVFQLGMLPVLYFIFRVSEITP